MSAANGPSAARRMLGVVVLTLALAPSGAQGFSKAVFGPVYRGEVNQFPLYQQLGASIYEAYLYWNLAAPRRPRHATDPVDPAYRWPVAIGQAVAQAKLFHMRVMLELIGTPQWANGGRPWNWVPNLPADYAAFAAAAARRYPSVHLWMVWGEPNRSGDFMPETRAKPGAALNRIQRIAPHNYARLLDAAYRALKQRSKANRVIGGSTFTAGDIDTEQWIQNLRLPNGRPPPMDMYAHNPFSHTDPSFSAPPSRFGLVQFSDLPRLARWIDRYLHPGIPIFLSEWEIPTAPDEEFPYWVDPSVASRWIQDALRLARGWHRIYALGWVQVYDDPPRSSGGLIYANGVHKPGFAAFATG